MKKLRNEFNKSSIIYRERKFLFFESNSSFEENTENKIEPQDRNKETKNISSAERQTSLGEISKTKEAINITNENDSTIDALMNFRDRVVSTQITKSDKPGYVTIVKEIKRNYSGLKKNDRDNLKKETGINDEGVKVLGVVSSETYTKTEEVQVLNLQEIPGGHKYKIINKGNNNNEIVLETSHPQYDNVLLMKNFTQKLSKHLDNSPFLQTHIRFVNLKGKTRYQRTINKY